MAARLDPFEPMTVDAVVDIGSVSKQFAATATLLLAERGEVDLGAPLVPARFTGFGVPASSWHSQPWSDWRPSTSSLLVEYSSS